VRGVWYVYAYDNDGDGTIETLDISPVGHSTDAFGVETKTGDTSRVLVGMVAIDTAAGTPIFVNSDVRPWVRSYFNRSASPMAASFTSATITGAGLNSVWTEIGTRFEPLMWAGESLRVGLTGNSSNSASAVNNSYSWQFDTWNGLEQPGATVSITAAATNFAHSKAIMKKGLAEGLHVASAAGFKSGGTGTFSAHQEGVVIA
jgi:hypothetical protein